MWLTQTVVMLLEGRTALVTGSARRVGREIAIELARAGADIVAHYHTSGADVESLVAEIRGLGRQCRPARADLADIAAVEGLVAELGAGPPVDILVNSASVFPLGRLGEVTAAEWDAVMAVNLRAPFLLARGLGLAMKGRGWGRIVNIGDCATGRPYKNYLPYLTSKAALEAMTRGLAVELAPEVLVNTVSPGVVLPPEDSTSRFEERVRRNTLLQRAGEPGDVARAVRYLVAEAPYTTGANLRVDGGAGMR